ncbi:MAG: flagellar hook protein FlgE [Acidobacteria bacterium]|nr:flagellar hook protein FlgE [Acidobacteriota bacterium]
MPLTSYYTALTGLNNNSYAINVIGDNLANMNTTAFKSGQATFAELLAGISGTDASGNPISAGLGSSVNGISHNYTQGTITNTGSTTDAAVNGNGFFVVSANGEMGFTRSGAFKFDSDGNLISSDGFQVMGYMGANGVIDASGAIVPIEIRKGQIIPAGATTNMSINANLDAQAADDDTFSTAVQIYDSLGQAHTVTVTYTKTGAGAWDWSAAIPAIDVGGSADDPPVEVGSGSMVFDGDGIMTDPTVNPALTISGFSNNATDMEVTFALLDAEGNPTITNYARDSAVSSTAQDGYSASALSTISIDRSGVIIGLTETGRAVSLAQMVLADFPNLEGLQKYKGSTYVAFTSSGEPSIGTAGTGGRGIIVGSSLEQSNVDMAQEFVNLIKSQRAYQANSRIIVTTDELYQDTISLKR